MKLISVTPKIINKYIHTFVATYLNEEGNNKEYEVVTRDKNLNIDTFGADKEANAVGMIMLSEDNERILLSKEFRLACNNWVYNFPGGLIDKGETARQAATRELHEETGLELVDIISELGSAYAAVGISDETVKTIIGHAKGNFGKSTSADEEIEAGWYTKEEVKKLLSENAKMSMRTQTFLYLWALGL